VSPVKFSLFNSSSSFELVSTTTPSKQLVELTLYHQESLYPATDESKADSALAVIVEVGFRDGDEVEGGIGSYRAYKPLCRTLYIVLMI